MKRSTVLLTTIAVLTIAPAMATAAPALAERPIEQPSCAAQPLKSQLLQSQPAPSPTLGTAKDLQPAAPQNVNLYCFFGVGSVGDPPVKEVRSPIAPESPKGDPWIFFRITF